jgi:hypothetical protein
MAILSDFFIAESGSVPDYHGDADFPAVDRCQFKSITPLEAAGVLSVLRGGGDAVELIGEFIVLTPEDAEEWTMSIPDDMVTTLATLAEPHLSEVAQQCSVETADEIGWSQDDFQVVLSQLRDLSVRAGQTGRKIYLWNSL